jgi:hypothetical protein
MRLLCSPLIRHRWGTLLRPNRRTTGGPCRPFGGADHIDLRGPHRVPRELAPGQAGSPRQEPPHHRQACAAHTGAGGAAPERAEGPQGSGERRRGGREERRDSEAAKEAQSTGSARRVLWWRGLFGKG